MSNSLVKEKEEECRQAEKRYNKIHDRYITYGGIDLERQQEIAKNELEAARMRLFIAKQERI